MARLASVIKQGFHPAPPESIAGFFKNVRMDPAPAKRLAEVADIAETIIKTLLPDDEDDRRDLIDDDY